MAHLANEEPNKPFHRWPASKILWVVSEGGGGGLGGEGGREKIVFALFPHLPPAES